jgi:hypothetical protein
VGSGRVAGQAASALRSRGVKVRSTAPRARPRSRGGRSPRRCRADATRAGTCRGRSRDRRVTRSGRRRGRPTLLRISGTGLRSGISWVTSLGLPHVRVQASGIPLASTRRWCFDPFLALSTGLGPVAEPLYEGGRWDKPGVGGARCRERAHAWSPFDWGRRSSDVGRSGGVLERGEDVVGALGDPACGRDRSPRAADPFPEREVMVAVGA